MPNFVSPKDRGSPCGEEVLNKMTLGTVYNMVRVIHNSDAEVTGNFNTVTVISNSDAEVTGNRNMVTALCGGSAEVSNQNDQVVLKAPCLGR